MSDLVVTKNGVPLADQAEGIRQFKEACRQKPASGLVERLRNAKFVMFFDGWSSSIVAIEAADRIEELERQVRELEGATTYAERLTANLHGKHYAENTEWEPLSGDLVGLLTQIDNMTAGLVRRATALEEAAKIIEETTPADAFSLNLLKEVIGDVITFRDMGPEEDENWESWYFAAFDMLIPRIRETFERNSLAPDRVYAPAIRKLAEGGEG